MDLQYSKHWTKYAEDYLQELKNNNFDQDSKTLIEWVKKFKTHDKDLAFHQKMTTIYYGGYNFITGLVFQTV